MRTDAHGVFRSSVRWRLPTPNRALSHFPPPPPARTGSSRSGYVLRYRLSPSPSTCVRKRSSRPSPEARRAGGRETPRQRRTGTRLRLAGRIWSGWSGARAYARMRGGQPAGVASRWRSTLYRSARPKGLAAHGFEELRAHTQLDEGLIPLRRSGLSGPASGQSSTSTLDTYLTHVASPDPDQARPA